MKSFVAEDLQSLSSNHIPHVLALSAFLLYMLHKKQVNQCGIFCSISYLFVVKFC